MNWLSLTSEEQFQELLQTVPVFAVFKHSTRCSISSMTKNRVERDWNLNFPIYYLDLLNFRSVSNFIAEKSGVEHESPQLLVFRNAKVVYHASHSGIMVNDIEVELV